MCNDASNKTSHSEKRIENETSRIRSVTKWKSDRDGGQILKEIQHFIRYYKEVFMSNDKLFGNNRYCISQWLVKSEDSLPQSRISKN